MKYFDEEQNSIDKEEYYKGVDPENETGLGLQLSTLLEKTHVNHLRYKPSLHLYPVVDRQQSGKLFSIYSGKEFDLSELLIRDAEVELIRYAQIRKQQDLLGRSLTEQEVMMSERGHPYNCEHVVPQSWFGESEPMRGDLHHLFTCEEDCNNFRKHYKYHDFPDYREVIKDECGKLERELFEPERNKGVVARAVLYCLIRYPGVINQYNLDDVKMLVKWHLNEEVSLFELHRNQQIFRMQGNRNPFIDFPDWVNKVEFEPDTSERELFSSHAMAVETESAKSFTADAVAGCTKNPGPWRDRPWRVAQSLLTLKKQVDQLAPNRRRASDGSIGDLRHEGTNSDHNPQILDPETKMGVVTAIDITHDPGGKCDCHILAESLAENRDARIKYVIWNRLIINSSPVGASPAWVWRPYNGTNPHDKHIHISSKCEKNIYDSTTAWAIKIN